MKLALVAVGSRGDIEPYIALGQRLQARGHTVRLAAQDLFQPAIADAGLEFHSLGALPKRFQPREPVPGARPRRDASTLFRGLPGRALFWAFFPSLLRPALDRFISACEGMDAVVHTRLSLPVPHVAEALGIACFAGFPVPHAPTVAFENPLYVREGRPSPPRRNLRTYAVEWGLTHQLSYRLMMKFRQTRLGLPRIPRRRMKDHLDSLVRGSLFSFSELVLPRPADWPDNVQVTGYWSSALPTGYTPPPALDAFLARGEAPVCVGFGSMKSSDPAQVGTIVREALASVGRRAVVQAGWSHLDLAERASEQILVIGEVPHAWLFPRVAAVVHHGGAGTTGSALTAGVPSVIVPHAFDQHFWGRRLAELRCGPPPIDATRLSTATLAAALRAAVHDAELRETARQLGQRLRAEDGTGRAAEQLERWMGVAA